MAYAFFCSFTLDGKLSGESKNFKNPDGAEIFSMPPLYEVCNLQNHYALSRNTFQKFNNRTLSILFLNL